MERREPGAHLKLEEGNKRLPERCTRSSDARKCNHAEKHFIAGTKSEQRSQLKSAGCFR